MKRFTLEHKSATEETTPALRRQSKTNKPSIGFAALDTAAGTESFIALEAPPGLDFESSWKALHATYQGVLRDARLDLESEVFLRLHLSDAANQAGLLRDQLGARGEGGLVSVIGQSPLQHNKVALEAYHVKGNTPCRRRRYPGGQMVVDHGRYQMIWGAFRPGESDSSAEQTIDLLRQLDGLANTHGGSLCDILLRTWFFVRDIDRNYMGLVDARRDLFTRCGMTAETHYVASTGIAGEMQRPDDLVAMDALLECGLAPGQIRFMTAETHLCPTHQYGVTFERGTRIVYGDRAHCLISGTASIDNQGRILHECDLDGQVERTLENIEALLSRQDMHLSDLKQAVVYLRDPSDGPRARMLLGSLLPTSVPLIVVEARVCRPGWLVEIEGIAATAAGDARFADYF
jgi:enamine deaminase RidA (YjgF/YER057c/UK114 family)